MRALLLHMANVCYELHGGSPKSYAGRLKREIKGRLVKRVLVGDDQPMLSDEVLVRDWHADNNDAAARSRVFHANGTVLRARPGLS